MNLKDLSEIAPWEWPEEAGTIVLEALISWDSPKQDRVLAVELAGELSILDDKIGHALVNIVRSDKEPVELRCDAAIALGPGLEEADLGDYEDTEDLPALSKPFVNEIQQTFQKLYSDANVPADIRRRVLEASVRNARDWHTNAVRTSYESDNRDWRLTAVFCMEYVHGFEEQIVESLKIKDPDILFHAVRAAGNWEIDEAWPKVAKLVTASDTEKQLRLAAIEAAAYIRPSETEILEPLVDSYDEDISEAAMDALADMRHFSEEEEDEFDEDDFEEDDPGKKK